MLVNTEIISRYFDTGDLGACQNHSFMRYIVKQATGLDEIHGLSYTEEEF